MYSSGDKFVNRWTKITLVRPPITFDRAVDSANTTDGCAQIVVEGAPLEGIA